VIGSLVRDEKRMGDISSVILDKWMHVKINVFNNRFIHKKNIRRIKYSPRQKVFAQMNEVLI